MISSIINFKQFINFDSNTLNDLANKMQNQKYHGGNGLGFVIKNKDTSHLLGYLIVDIPGYITDFDPNQAIIIKTKTMRKNIIEFMLDSDHCLLETYSDKNNTNRLITELGKISNFSLSIEDIHFRANEIIEKLESNNIQYAIKNLRIRDFSINEFTIGSFFVNILSQEEGIRLIQKYNPFITYIGLNFSISKEEFSIGLYESGAMRFFNKQEDPIENLVRIKELLFHR